MKRTLLASVVFSLGVTQIVGCGAQSGSSVSEVKDTAILNKGRYVYFTTPWRDFVSSERAEAVVDAQNFVVGRMKKVFPDSEITEATSKELNANKQQIEDILKDADSWFLDKRDEINEIGIDFKTVLVPSAFMIVTGMKKTINTAVGGGFDITVGAVVIPTKVTRIDKVTKDVKTWTSLRVSLVGLPAIQVGAGVGVDLGVTYKFGVGMIWNKLDRPEDFTGFAAGFAGSYNMGFGNSVKVGLLKRDSKSDTLGNPFAFASWNTGAAAQTEWHGFGGYVLPLSKYVKALALSEEITVEKTSSKK